MEVVSFRVPSELKKKMREIGINWSEEIRKFIETKVREYEKARTFEEIDVILSKIREAEKGTASRYIREDRDRR